MNEFRETTFPFKTYDVRGEYKGLAIVCKRRYAFTRICNQGVIEEVTPTTRGLYNSLRNIAEESGYD